MSAKMSFFVSALLFGIYLLILKRDFTKRNILLALIPLFFSLQQFSEGLVWISTTNTQIQFFSYVYLFFAFFLWPFFIPYFLYSIENPHCILRKKIFSLFRFIGIITGLLLLIFLFTSGIKTIKEEHIRYILKKDQWQYWTTTVGAFLYIISVVVPFFFSSYRHIRWFGVFIAGAALITIAVQSLWFTSLWCFYAALMSSYVLFLKQKINAEKSEEYPTES